MSYYMVNSFRSLDLPDLSWRTDRKGAKLPARIRYLTVPLIGLLADAYSFFGMRPER